MSISGLTPPPPGPSPTRTHYAVLRDAPFPVPWHDRGLFNLNLLAIRSSAPDVSDRFDDALVVSYRGPVPGGAGAVGWITRWFPCTTDPGKPYRQSPMNPSGCAVIAPGHYHLSHAIGSHKGRPALRQVGPLRVWRVAAGRPLDRSRATRLAGPECALNVHCGPDLDDEVEAGRVGRWSAGCVVTARRRDLQVLLDLVLRQRAHGSGDRVSLTLVDTRDVPVASTLLAAALDGGEGT